jgi:hypothetical protein
MKKLIAFLIASCALLGGLGIAAAQDKSDASMQPPKLLTIYREFMKPGRAGAAHEKTEVAFVQAMTKAQWPTHYLAVDSASGRPRSLFLTGYDSFDAWANDIKAQQKNAILSSSLDKASMSDGEMQSDADAGAFVYRDDLSLHAGLPIATMRYFEISLIHVKPGHSKDFEALAKMYMNAWTDTPEVHWAMYETVYGQSDNTFLVFSPLKSAAEIDQNFARGKDFDKKLGEDGMKKVQDLWATAVEDSQTNLFVFNPRISYVSPEWVKADPDFWTVKPATGMASGPKKMENKMAKKAAAGKN